MNYRKEKQPPRRERQSAERSTMFERRERRLVLVVTNGKKTEPNYFNAFKTLLPKGTLEPYFVEFHEGNQKQVVECAVAKHKEEKYDEVWAVLDVEDHDPDSNSFPAALALAKKNGVEVVYSNRQIEVWFLFHFPQGREIDQSMQGCKTIEKLNECLFSTGIQEGYKKSHSVFNVLLHHGEEPAAINHAEEILIKARKKFPNEEWRYNPSTTVHRLVKRLREMVEP